MNIKRLYKQDLKENHEIISRLILRTFTGNFPDIDCDFNLLAQEKTNDLCEYLEQGSAVVFASYDEGMNGIVWAFRRVLCGEARMHINYIAVDPSCEKQGIGKRLIDEVERYAIEQGIPGIDLMVSSINNIVVQWYENNGFSIERFQMYKPVTAK